jgi:hypothetical protein
MGDQVNKSLLEKEFATEIYTNIRKAKEIGYKPVMFDGMLGELGVLAASKMVIRDESHVKKGFIRLWELGSLGLSVEATIIQTKYKPLFTEEEIAICKKRLKAYKYLQDGVE